MNETHDVVHISVVIDESGSMGGKENAVIEGTNQFIESLKSEDKDIRTTLTMFDARGAESVRVKWEDVPIKQTPRLTLGDYTPTGMTPLNDAIIRSIRNLESRVHDGHRPLLVVFTDGLENASETTTETVREAIEIKEKEGWKFIYLGANQDAWAEGGARGFADNSSYNWSGSAAGVGSTMSSVSQLAVSHTRGTYDEDAKKLHRDTGGTIPDEVPDIQEAIKIAKGEEGGEKE